jgi:hypothetical protein
MNAKKLGLGVGLAGVGVFAAWSLGPKLHEHCQSMCAGKCGGPDDKEGSVHHSYSPQATREVAAVA